MPIIDYTNMNKEIGKIEWECKLITKNGKYLGYSDNDSMRDREWYDEPIKAITWSLKLDDPSKILPTHLMESDDVKLIKVKKTIIIESYE